MVYAKEIYKGKFIPTNYSKYLGDVTNIIYRSSYELKFMKWCDMNNSVIGWVSEEVAIPYRNPIDNKIHRYMVDFYAEIQQKDGSKQGYLIEVKSKRITHLSPKRSNAKQYLQKVAHYVINEAKLIYTKAFCKKFN